jgi:hypothetical protein
MSESEIDSKTIQGKIMRVLLAALLLALAGSQAFKASVRLTKGVLP